MMNVQASRPKMHRPQARSLKQALTGVAALSRLGAFHQDLGGRRDSFSYRRMRNGAEVSPEGSFASRTSPEAKRRKSRHTLVVEESLRLQLEEENRKRAARYVEDDKWEEANTTVWFPCQHNKRAWDGLILVVLLYSVVVEPFRIGLSVSAEGWQWVLDAVLSILFIMDIVFTFNTAYLETHLEGDNWVIDRGMIAQNYLAWRFYIELPSAYPAEIIDFIASYFEWEVDHTRLRLLRMMRLLRMVRVMRELRVIYGEVLLWFESRLQANLAAFHLVGPLTILVYLIHLLACSFTFVAKSAMSRGYEESWMTTYDHGAALESSTRQQYLMALYWASGTATGLGTGVQPSNEIEWLFVSCAHIVGVVVMGSVIGSIAHSIEASASPIEKMIEQKTDIVKDITRWRAMPPELADSVIRFYSHYARKQSASLADETALLDSLAVAPSLRREVLKHLLGRSVALIPMFTMDQALYATDEFQLAVDPMLRPVVLEEGELIFEQGSLRSSKSAPQMTLLFLCEGAVKASTRIGSREKMLYTIREEGDLFGEHTLLSQRSDVTCYALMRCDLFSLSLHDLFSLLDRFPEAREEFGELVLDAAIRHKWQRFFSLRITCSDQSSRLSMRAGPDGAALRIQLAVMRKQIQMLRRHSPQEVMPLLFASRSEQHAAISAGSATTHGAHASHGSAKQQQHHLLHYHQHGSHVAHGGKRHGSTGTAAMQGVPHVTLASMNHQCSNPLAPTTSLSREWSSSALSRDSQSSRDLTLWLPSSGSGSSGGGRDGDRQQSVLNYQPSLKGGAVPPALARQGSALARQRSLPSLDADLIQPTPPTTSLTNGDAQDGPRAKVRFAAGQSPSPQPPGPAKMTTMQPPESGVVSAEVVSVAEANGIDGIAVAARAATEAAKEAVETAKALEAKMEARLQGMDVHLTALRDSIDANSIALGILLQGGAETAPRSTLPNVSA